MVVVDSWIPVVVVVVVVIVCDVAVVIVVVYVVYVGGVIYEVLLVFVFKNVE